MIKGALAGIIFIAAYTGGGVVGRDPERNPDVLKPLCDSFAVWKIIADQSDAAPSLTRRCMEGP
jgi:hypothetical protein